MWVISRCIFIIKWSAQIHVLCAIFLSKLDRCSVEIFLDRWLSQLSCIFQSGHFVHAASCSWLLWVILGLLRCLLRLVMVWVFCFVTDDVLVLIGLLFAAPHASSSQVCCSVMLQNGIFPCILESLGWKQSQIPESWCTKTCWEICWFVEARFKATC